MNNQGAAHDDAPLKDDVIGSTGQECPRFSYAARDATEEWKGCAKRAENAEEI